MCPPADCGSIRSLDEAGILTTAALSAAMAVCAAPAAAQDAPGCDVLDPAACLYPWPNDHFTAADPSAPTGRSLALRDEMMPRNRLGKPVSAAPYNHSDGFSPGNMIVTKVPGLDAREAFCRTGAVPIADIERSFDSDQPVVVINARTLERHLIWSELDANPADPRDVTLIVRPAVNFEEGERYIVVLRDLRDARGRRLAPQAPFRPARPADSPGDLAEPEGALRVDLHDAAPRRHPPQRPLPRLGLHRRQPRQPERPRARDPRPGIRRARRHRPVGPRRRGRVAPVRPGPARSGGPGRLDPPRGHGHGALLPRPARLPAGVAVLIGPDGLPSGSPATPRSRTSCA